MATWLDEIQNCERCGSIDSYFSNYNCSTHEEYNGCSVCGKMNNWIVDKDKLGNPILTENQDGKKIALIKNIEKEGYGVIRLVYKDDKEKITTEFLDKPLTEKDVEKLREQFNDYNLDKIDSYVTAWDNNKKEISVLFGSNPYKHTKDIDCDDIPF